MSPWRASNLAARLGPAWDGDWWLDDVDVAIFTLPILDNLKDSDAAMRVLTAAYAQHISSRRGEARRPSMLLFDEFGSLAGGAGPGHQHRGAGQVVGRWVLLSAQSAAGLGSEPERERLLAASSARGAVPLAHAGPGWPPWPGPNAPPRAPGRSQVAQMFHLTG
jgi:hypothetical protein